MDTRYPRREECINIKCEKSAADRESLGEKRRNKRNLNTHTDCIVSQKDRDQLLQHSLRNIYYTICNETLVFCSEVTEMIMKSVLLEIKFSSIIAAVSLFPLAIL